MKYHAENRLTAYKTVHKERLGRLLSRLLPLLIIASMLFANMGMAFAEDAFDIVSAQAPGETSAAAAGESSSEYALAGGAADEEPSSEQALAGEGSGQDVTIHFGEDEKHAIRIHVNPVSETVSPAGAEAGPVPAQESETAPAMPLEDGTEAETETGTQKEYTYEDENVKVVATLQYAWAVPDGAELRVTQIRPDSKEYNYSAYMEALNESNPDAVMEYSDENTLLYDIAFYVKKLDENGEEIEGSAYEFEPEEGSVDVSVEFKKSQLTEGIGLANSEDVTITHLPLKEEVRKEVDSTAEAVNIQASDIEPETLAVKDDSVVLRQDDMDEVSFKTDSFSTYAFSNGTAAEIQSVQDFDLASYLGAADNYGIVVNTYVHGGDTETNLMAGTYQSNAADVGASMNYSNAGGNYYFGSMVGFSNGSIVRFHLEPATVFLGPAATAQYENREFKFEHLGNGTIVKNSSIDVAAIIRSIGTKFDQLDSLGGTFNKTIDLRQLPAGTYIVRFDGNTIDEGALDLQLNPDQKLIINCTSTNLKIGRYHIQGQQPSSYIGNSDPSVDWLTTAVVFNMVNDGTVHMEESMGVVINPNGTVKTSGGACGGILIANSTEGSNEWHYHNHNLDSPDSKQLKAYKNIDGKSANVSGFRFVLSRKDGSAWTPIQTKQNNGHEINFDSILYNAENCTQDVTEFLYKIEESKDVSAVEDQDTEYGLDASVYYAQVQVTRYSSGNERTFIASTPVYYADEACTEPLEGVPVFENESRIMDLNVKKAWKKSDGTLLTGNYPADSITFTLYQVMQTEGPFTTPPTEGGTAFDTYTIQKDGTNPSTTADDWTLTIEDLPLQADESGTIQYYGYYVVEDPLVEGYEVSYENYSLTTHDITIVNEEEDKTSITVDKKWFRGTEEVEGPAESVTFDLYRTESTTPDTAAGAVTAAAAETVSDAGNQAEPNEAITDYNLKVRWGDYNANHSKDPVQVHAGDRVHIEATSLSAANATYVIHGNSIYLRETIAGTSAVEDTKTIIQNGNTNHCQVITTTFDYVIPAVEKMYNFNDTTKVYDLNLEVLFGNNGVFDENASVSVTVTPAASLRAASGSSGPGGSMTHAQASSQSGTSVWDGETHRYTLSAEEGWTRTIPSLKMSGKNSAGQTVYYSYYVVEQPGAAYDLADTTYENNGGIQSGTITIWNKIPDYIYTSTFLHVTKKWLGNADQNITASKNGSITFVLKQVMYENAQTEQNSDSDVFKGGTLEAEEGVSFDRITGRYTIQAQEHGKDASGNTVYVWPTASISNLPYQVKREDGTVIYEYKYIVEEIDKNGKVDATYVVGDGEELGYCEETNDGSGVTIINREMAAYSLPATGGAGARMVYLMSILLVGLAGAGLVLARRRRLSWYTD